MTMTHSATAIVPTENGSKYLQQLCKHWSHNLEVTFSPEEGSVTFPKDGRAGEFEGDAVLSLSAQAETLTCQLDASEAPQLEILQRVVAEHLDRFAHKESPLTFDWQKSA